MNLKIIAKEGIKMMVKSSPSRILGVAFLLQFFTSLISGVVLRPALIVPGDIRVSLINIANNALLMRANILLDMLTALGIIFLGVILFLALRNQSEKVALIALGFYVLEAVLLAVSRIAAFALVPISQEYAATGYPGDLQVIGNVALQSMDFGGATLHMLVFGCGGILFYYLMYQSGIVPRILSLWGLITTVFTLIATLFVLFGFQVSMVVYLPYVPFEFAVGIWILFRGIYDVSEQGHSGGAARRATT
ncbi:MAG TPA: DUF4386 domain-containing protein [Phototrophicaceae bacterium]|nr:DUF4386 domain-containing protein [Phototrophicaceae bacterium]